MNPPLVLRLWQLGGVALSALALWGGYEAWALHERNLGQSKAIEACNAQTTRQNEEAAALLESERELKLRREKVWATQLNKQEIDDVVNGKTISLLADKLDAAGRVRDPYAQAPACGQSGSGAQGGIDTSAGNSPGDGARAGRELSPEFDRFLKERFKRADEINTAYISCRADSLNLRLADHLQ